MRRLICLGVAVLLSACANTQPAQLEIYCNGQRWEEGAVRYGQAGEKLPWQYNLRVFPAEQRAEEFSETGSRGLCDDYQPCDDLKVTPSLVDISRRAETGDYRFTLDRKTGRAAEMGELTHYPRITEGTGPEYTEHMDLTCTEGSGNSVTLKLGPAVAEN